VTTASLSIVYDQPIAMTPTTARVGFASCTSVTTMRSSARPCASTGNPADAEDVLQTSSCASWPRGNAIEATPPPAAYFRRAAVNAAVDLLRRRAVHAESAYDDRAPHAAVEPPSLLKEQLRRAIAPSTATTHPVPAASRRGAVDRRAGRDVPTGEEQRGRPAPPDPAPAADGNGAMTEDHNGDQLQGAGGRGAFHLPALDKLWAP